MSGILLQIGGADVSVYRETSRDTDSRHLDLDSVQGVHIMVSTWTVHRVSTSRCPPGQCKRGTSCHFILRGAENRQHRLILFLLTGAAHGSKEDGSIPLQMYA